MARFWPTAGLIRECSLWSSLDGQDTRWALTNTTQLAPQDHREHRGLFQNMMTQREGPACPRSTGHGGSWNTAGVSINTQGLGFKYRTCGILRGIKPGKQSPQQDCHHTLKLSQLDSPSQTSSLIRRLRGPTGCWLHPWSRPKAQLLGGPSGMSVPQFPKARRPHKPQMQN